MIKVETLPSEPPRGLVTADAVARLGASAAALGAMVEDVILEATALGERIAPGKWVYRKYTERIVLTKWSKRLYLQARPVQSVTSVVFSDDDPIVEGTKADEFEIWPKHLYMEDGWFRGEPGWRVTYFGGYWLPASMGPTPADTEAIDAEGLHLQRAIWETVQSSWAKDQKEDPDTIREKSDNTEVEWSTTRIPVSVPPSAQSVFANEGPPPV